MATFTVVLGPTYYDKGFLNPGVEASRHLGKDGDPIRILFDDGSEPVISRIDQPDGQSNWRCPGCRPKPADRHLVSETLQGR
ncbi:hypothetical protein J1C56_31425 [Aminobacter anthyllidis]|uniref:Uncharacterized protein n=1 Tax=Aminobacter anthyllidis TaxID=1035067 RepID=A0A9X1AHX6_9HYPH|nr:hypothetical protein [Aminobacter anthyllidis]MBT1160043.1 hypothetical protein [Aminobacter anthyllidis]